MRFVSGRGCARRGCSCRRDDDVVMMARMSEGEKLVESTGARYARLLAQNDAAGCQPELCPRRPTISCDCVRGRSRVSPTIISQHQQNARHRGLGPISDSAWSVSLTRANIPPSDAPGTRHCGYWGSRSDMLIGLSPKSLNSPTKTFRLFCFFFNPFHSRPTPEPFEPLTLISPAQFFPSRPGFRPYLFSFSRSPPSFCSPFSSFRLQILLSKDHCPSIASLHHQLASPLQSTHKPPPCLPTPFPSRTRR